MNEKYILTDETFEGTSLRRIQYVKDIPRYNIKAGNLGGWMLGGDVKLTRANSYFSHEGDCVIAENAMLFEGAVTDNSFVGGNSNIWSYAIVCDQAKVTGRAKLHDRCVISDDAIITGDTNVCGRAEINNNIILSGGFWDKSPVFINAPHININLCDNTVGKEKIQVNGIIHDIGDFLELCKNKKWNEICGLFMLFNSEPRCFKKAYNFIAEEYELPKITE